MAETIIGYERVTSGEGCDLCESASGQLYHIDDLMPIHDHCGCSVEPVTATTTKVYRQSNGRVIDPAKLKPGETAWSGRLPELPGQGIEPIPTGHPTLAERRDAMLRYDAEKPAAVELVEGVNAPVTGDYLAEFYRLPPEVRDNLDPGSIVIAARPLSRIPGLERLRGVKVPGHGGLTWDSMMGGYFSREGKVYVTTSATTGSGHTLIHEVGHYIGDRIPPSWKKDLLNFHLELYDKLTPYHKVGGPGGRYGMNELFAETFAMYLENPASVLAYTNSEYTAWLDHVIRQWGTRKGMLRRHP